MKVWKLNLIALGQEKGRSGELWCIEIVGWSSPHQRRVYKVTKRRQDNDGGGGCHEKGTTNDDRVVSGGRDVDGWAVMGGL